MHETLSNDILGHTDLEETLSFNFKACGWAYSKTLGIRDIRMVYQGKHILLLPLPRSDVDRFYNGNGKLVNVGWSIDVEITEVDNSLELEMDLNGIWTIFYRKTFGMNIFQCLTDSTPRVWVVDDFYTNPDQVRNFALQQEFKEHKKYHKGYRTEVTFRPNTLKEAFERILNRKIINWEHYPVNGAFQYCTKEHQLVYHQDVQQYAGVIYLTPNAPVDSGTSLFKSKVNNIMSVTAKTAKQAGKTFDELFAETFSAGFLDRSGYEAVDSIGNVYNRCVLWNAQTIHAANNYFGDSKEDGRLFHLFFFDLR